MSNWTYVLCHNLGFKAYSAEQTQGKRKKKTAFTDSKNKKAKLHYFCNLASFYFYINSTHSIQSCININLVIFFQIWILSTIIPSDA